MVCSTNIPEVWSRLEELKTKKNLMNSNNTIGILLHTNSNSNANNQCNLFNIQHEIKDALKQISNNNIMLHRDIESFGGNSFAALEEVDVSNPIWGKQFAVLHDFTNI